MTKEDQDFLSEHELPAGIYKHYKGGFYQCLGVAAHSETEELFVVYVSLSGAHLPGPRIRCRPIRLWFEPVDGRPRFEFVGQEIIHYS